MTILVVDDEAGIRNALKRFLVARGHEVELAATGDEALELVRRQKVTCVLLDVLMPGTSGVDLVLQLLEADPDLAILMLTAVNDATAAALCMQRGALDYLTKPIDLDVLVRAIQRAVDKRQARLDDRQASRGLRDEVERISVATLEALVNALEAKDPYLRGHSARVAECAAAIAAAMGLGDEEIDQVRTAGRLHDIGKIGIREDVINKLGPLTDEEFEHVKQHVLIGSQILSPLVHLRELIGFVRSHHERWDGSGYPEGLRGEAIPWGARIIGAVEIFDALTTSRPYQEKMPVDTAVERMRDLSGTVLDPAVFAAIEEAVLGRQTLGDFDSATR